MLKGFKYYYSRFGYQGVLSALKMKLNSKNYLMKVERDEFKAPFYLRHKTSDLPTYNQLFIKHPYSFSVERPIKIIVDAGANIGLATLFFANRFPEAKIIAIEPEDSNFELLKKNVSPYQNVTPLKAALWHRNEELDIVDPGFGNWGYMTDQKDDSDHPPIESRKTVKAITINHLLEEYNLDTIDILKIDIEGAEREVFSDSSSWLPWVDSMIVELHERLKKGCNRSFYNGSNGFDDEWIQGENVYLTRKGCLIRP